MTIAIKLKEWYAKIPADAWYIAFLLVASRITLTLISVASRYLLNDNKAPATQYISSIFLDVWGQWDTTHYINIATKGYADSFTYGWFPFYGILIRIVNYVVNNAFIAGLIVSNVALVVACVYFYKYVRLRADADVAFRSVKYLLLWPTAFVLSGVFTESTFLALTIAAFYYGEKRRWILVGVLGFCAALTRPVGFMLVVPLLYAYLQQRGFKLKAIKADILSVLGIPLGTAAYGIYCYLTKGDALAYMHAQFTITGPLGREPISILHAMASALHGSVQEMVWLSFILVSFVLLVVFVRRFTVSHWLLCASLLVLPLTTSIAGTGRYTLVLFPFFMLFADLSKNDAVDTLLTISFALIQGCLIIFWGYPVMA